MLKKIDGQGLMLLQEELQSYTEGSYNKMGKTALKGQN